MMLNLQHAAAQHPTDNAAAPWRGQEVNMNRLLPPQQILYMMREAVEYGGRLTKSREVQEFVDSTGCLVHVNGFYNHVAKPDEKPNGIVAALMEWVKNFFGRGSGAANQPRIGVDVHWMGLNDVVGKHVNFRSGVSTQMEATTTVGSHFGKERVEAFATAIKSYTDTSLSIADSKASGRIIAELRKLRVSPFTIELLNGSKLSGRDSVLLISAEPAMPDIRARVSSPAGGTYKMKLVVSYFRPCTAASSRSPRQTTSFPATGWQEVAEGEEWKVAFGTDEETHNPTIRGGIAYLVAESQSGARDTIRFFIKGTNPTVAQVNTFLSQNPYEELWFFKKIIFHESDIPIAPASEAKQFNSYNRGKEDLSENNWEAFSRMPNFGHPCGWGLGQMDNPQPPAQTLWDWKANIAAAYKLLNVGKREDVTTNLNKALNIVDSWKDPSYPVITQPDSVEGGITYTHAQSPSIEHEINSHFNGQPGSNSRSFIDACWIKLYNGLGSERQHYYWLAPGIVKKNGKILSPKWHITSTATYNGHTNHYVRDVSQRSTP
jgi:hypothetical protein